MQISGITVYSRLPSAVPAGLLYTWTKFLIGEPQSGFRFAAIRPPQPKAKWLAAAICPDQVVIACSKTFSTPERAVEWLREAGQVLTDHSIPE